jgi:hypothetical protein
MAVKYTKGPTKTQYGIFGVQHEPFANPGVLGSPMAKFLQILSFCHSSFRTMILKKTGPTFFQ